LNHVLNVSCSDAKRRHQAKGTRRKAKKRIKKKYAPYTAGTNEKAPGSNRGLFYCFVKAPRRHQAKGARHRAKNQGPDVGIRQKAQGVRQKKRIKKKGAPYTAGTNEKAPGSNRGLFYCFVKVPRRHQAKGTRHKVKNQGPDAGSSHRA
jgi:hypothetical protein